MVVDDGQGAVDLFKDQHPAQVVGKGQGRERPYDIGTAFQGIGYTAESADNESEPPGVFSHVPGNNAGELLGGPGFAARVEHYNAVRRIQCRKHLLAFGLLPFRLVNPRFFDLDDIEWEESCRPGGIIRDQVSKVAVFRFSDPENP